MRRQAQELSRHQAAREGTPADLPHARLLASNPFALEPPSSMLILESVGPRDPAPLNSGETARRYAATFHWLSASLDSSSEQTLVAGAMHGSGAKRRSWPMLLPTDVRFLRLQAARTGDQRGLLFQDRLWSYGGLAAWVDALATELVAAGCTTGQRIAFRVPNSPLAVASHYAAWAIGATAAPLAARASNEEIARALDHLEPHALLLDPESVAPLEPVWRGRPLAVLECPPTPEGIVRVVSHPGREASKSRRSVARGLAVLAGTSGTTGKPKAVMLTHENLFWSALACSAARGDNGTEVGAALSALSHTPVFVSHVLCRILFGATVLLFPRFDVDALFWAVERYGITDLTLIGGMVFDVTRQGSVPPAVRERVRKVSVGGAFTPMSAKEALREIFPRSEIIEAYGQSEATNGVAMARGSAVFEHPGTVGRANPHVVVRVRKDDGSWAAPGEEGEIVVGGPTTMQGYWRDVAATRQALREGWLHTGDLGRMDEEGFLYITGRVKNIIITGGENVSPAEVEEVLRRHPAVADVAVLGTPHPKWGEQVTAVVVPSPGTSPNADDLVAFAAQHLAGFKKPRRIEFVDVLPRNAMNKVDLAALRARFVSPRESS